MYIYIYIFFVIILIKFFYQVGYMIDWFDFHNFYSFLYIIFILLGIVYCYNFAANNNSNNDDSDDCDDYAISEDCVTIQVKKSDLDNAVNAIKKLKGELKNMQ